MESIRNPLLAERSTSISQRAASVKFSSPLPEPNSGVIRLTRLLTATAFLYIRRDMPWDNIGRYRIAGASGERSDAPCDFISRAEDAVSRLMDSLDWSPIPGGDGDDEEDDEDEEEEDDEDDDGDTERIDTGEPPMEL
jgi:hypothetical protein